MRIGVGEGDRKPIAVTTGESDGRDDLDKTKASDKGQW